MNALNQLLPIAVGILVSPLPIVAIVAILLSTRGRTAAPAYTAAFAVVTLAFVGLGALSSAGASSAATGGSAVAVVLTIALTVGFAALAVASWLSRPRGGAPVKTPGWLAAVDTITPLRAAGLGAVMAVTNSKNIPLELTGGSLIGSAHLPALSAVLLCVALAVAGTLVLSVPTALAATGSVRVTRGLDRLKSTMIAHNAVIMTVLFALLAANEAAHLIHRIAA